MMRGNVCSYWAICLLVVLVLIAQHGTEGIVEPLPSEGYSGKRNVDNGPTDVSGDGWTYSCNWRDVSPDARPSGVDEDFYYRQNHQVNYAAHGWPSTIAIVNEDNGGDAIDPNGNDTEPQDVVMALSVTRANKSSDTLIQVFVAWSGRADANESASLGFDVYNGRSCSPITKREHQQVALVDDTASANVTIAANYPLNDIRVQLSLTDAPVAIAPDHTYRLVAPSDVLSAESPNAAPHTSCIALTPCVSGSATSEGATPAGDGDEDGGDYHGEAPTPTSTPTPSPPPTPSSNTTPPTNSTPPTSPSPSNSGHVWYISGWFFVLCFVLLFAVICIFVWFIVFRPRSGSNDYGRV